MSQQDANLLNCLEKLELDSNGSTKKKKPATNDGQTNIFMRRRRSKSLSSINFGTPCDTCIKKHENIKQTVAFKRTNKKILREPILKFIRCTHEDLHKKKQAMNNNNNQKERLFGQFSKQNDIDFKTIVDAYEQLSLDSNRIPTTVHKFKSPSFQNARTECRKNSGAPKTDSSMGSSCSHQARMNLVTPPCDVTIDELASYFETLVHIPKKMSSMAEMMYI